MPNPITADECDQIRRERETGTRQTTLATRYDTSTATISYHVAGRCTHDVPPLDRDKLPDRSLYSGCERAVLDTLADHDTLARKDLVASIDYSSGRVGTVLPTLKAEGLIESRPSLSDPRERIYSLTEAAPEAIQR